MGIKLVSQRTHKNKANTVVVKVPIENNTVSFSSSIKAKVRLCCQTKRKNIKLHIKVVTVSSSLGIKAHIIFPLWVFDCVHDYILNSVQIKVNFIFL
jgi:hypothetical protein